MRRSNTTVCLYLFTALFISLTSTAYAQSLRAPLQVSRAGLPVSIGVPVAESVDLRDPSLLQLTDAKGTPVPFQWRVLSRWRGTAQDSTRPVKWVLVDFTPSIAGSYYVTNSGGAVPVQGGINVVTVTDRVQITSSRISAEFPTYGSSLVSSLRIDAKEQLGSPVTVDGIFPRCAQIVAPVKAADTVIVNDASLIHPGATVRFRHTASLAWPVTPGATRLVSQDQQLQANHNYLIDEGTSTQETVLVAQAEYGVLTLATPCKYAHAQGAALRDITTELEVATVKSVSGQLVTFTAPLAQGHVINDGLRLDGTLPAAAVAMLDSAVVEESNSLRVVVRQDGHFSIPPATATESVSLDPTVIAPNLKFTLRYYIYQDVPFIRVRLRLMNQGTYGFGAARLQRGPYAQHVMISRLSVNVPAVVAGSGSDSVLDRATAYSRVNANQKAGRISAGKLELGVPEFAETYPKGLTGDSTGLHFDVFPATNSVYQFDGARARTTDFYLGTGTSAAIGMTSVLGAALDPAYVARTGAVRPLFVEKRDWSKQFPNDPELAEAAVRAERQFAVSYAVEQSDATSGVPAQSIFEYRLIDDHGNNLGWRNFGDLTWGDGYANVHYDLPFILLREFLRTGDQRAFQAGSEMARYRADWGHYHGDDYWDSEGAYNMRGIAFYEKADHGSDYLPVLTHNWIEGMWLEWALTGDESIHESVIEASQALERFMRYDFTIANAVQWNESRWLGWPALGLVAAYRYSGEDRYLDASKKAVYGLMNAEVAAGKKGWFIPATSGIGQITQPFMWAGYSQLGVIEYWRETNDQSVAAFIVRVADWLMGTTGSQPVLQGGRNLSDGRYLPMGATFNWAPDMSLDVPVTELAMLNLPVLLAAQRITFKPQYKAAARQLFRDVAFYRDRADGSTVTPETRTLINFRALQFGGSAPKAYGHTGLSLSEYLPDLTDSLVQPRKPLTTGSMLDNPEPRYVQVGQTLRVPLRTTALDGSYLNVNVPMMPPNSQLNTGEFVFTPTADQAGNLIQVTINGVSPSAALASRLDIVVVGEPGISGVHLINPKNTDVVVKGRATNISWTADSPSSIATYELRLSTDGGASYPVSLGTFPGSVTQYSWTLPDGSAVQPGKGLRLLLVAVDSQNRKSLDFTGDMQVAGQLAVVSAANYSPDIAPGSLCSAFGVKLAVYQAGLDDSPSVLQKNGTTVDITDSAGQYYHIPLLFADNVAGAGYDQVNFYLPEEVAPGQATITVTSSAGDMSTAYLNVSATAPGVFSIDQTGRGEASVVSTSDGVKYDVGFAKAGAAGDVYVSLFGTGWRFANQNQGGKALGTASFLQGGFQPVVAPVTVELNGVLVDVLFAGAQPDYMGLDQINIKLPAGLTAGLYPLIVRTGEKFSNTVLLRVK